MTNKEKDLLIKLRNEGYTYTEIRDRTGLSIGTIKSFISRNKEGVYCKYCAKPIYNKSGRKPKKFCCDECRLAWWKEHKDEVNKKAYYTLVCEECHKEFKSYGKKDRKFCSHVCYIRHRFKGGEDNE